MISKFRPTAALLLICSLLFTGRAQAADERPLELGPEGVYRMQPSFERSEMVIVPPEEIKPGLAYNYYNQKLGRRAWGIAREDGTFQYAFGEGTVVPTDFFDLRITPELRSMLLEQGSPGLEQALATTGGTPAVRLDATGRWNLVPVSSSGRVFDLRRRAIVGSGTASVAWRCFTPTAISGSGSMAAIAPRRVPWYSCRPAATRTAPARQRS